MRGMPIEVEREPKRRCSGCRHVLVPGSKYPCNDGCFNTTERRHWTPLGYGPEPAAEPKPPAPDPMALLEESIVHWRENLDLAKRFVGSGKTAFEVGIRVQGSACALCKAYAPSCEGCPVRKKTGRGGCVGTPWGGASALYFLSVTGRTVEAMSRMLAFLESLREPKPEPKTRRYCGECAWIGSTYYCRCDPDTPACGSFRPRLTPYEADVLEAVRADWCEPETVEAWARTLERSGFTSGPRLIRAIAKAGKGEG